MFGYGVIRLYQAITENVPAEAPNPIFDRLPAQVTTSTPTGLPSVLSTEPAKYPTVAGAGLLTLLVVGGVVVVVMIVVLVLVRDLDARGGVAAVALRRWRCGGGVAAVARAALELAASATPHYGRTESFAELILKGGAYLDLEEGAETSGDYLITPWSSDPATPETIAVLVRGPGSVTAAP